MFIYDRYLKEKPYLLLSEDEHNCTRRNFCTVESCLSWQLLKFYNCNAKSWYNDHLTLENQIHTLWDLVSRNA